MNEYKSVINEPLYINDPIVYWNSEEKKLEAGIIIGLKIGQVNIEKIGYSETLWIPTKFVACKISASQLRHVSDTIETDKELASVYYRRS